MKVKENGTVTCRLCGSTDYSLLHDGGRNSKPIYNYVCNRCGFVFILPRPFPGELDYLHHGTDYSETTNSSTILDNRSFNEFERAARIRLYILQQVTGDYLWLQNGQRSVLEVGCGTGSFLRLMRACGWKILGLEPDSAYSEEAKQRYDIPIQSPLLEDFHTEALFDLVCSFHTIEHVEDPNTFLKHIRDFLVDEGYLYLECPGIERWYGDSIDHFFWNAHINTFSQKTLSAFLAKNGFRVVSSGWNGNYISVLAAKDRSGNLRVSWDNPTRIRSIVEKARSDGGSRSWSWSAGRLTSRISRGMKLAKNNPSETTARILDKTTTHLSLFGRSHEAKKVAIRPGPFRSRLRLAHVGLHVNRNAGDTLLFPATRWLLQKHVAPIEFTLLDLHAPVTEETIAEINRHDGLVIGGGGLFLSDTNPNELSGWQWACPTDLMDEIEVPIIVFAVGYNRFRGQADFAPVFRDNVHKLVEKSVFFSVRNSGSADALRGYLPPQLHSKLIFQPCPTTVLNRFYPGIPKMKMGNERTMAINIAFDRHHLRYGKDEDRILWELAETLIELRGEGWRPLFFSHSSRDSEAHFWFRSRGLCLEDTELDGVAPDSIIKAYSKVSLAIGVRGHAQMIPFGLGRPIFSLISHDKLGFFLDDIGHPEWGQEIQEEGLGDRILQMASAFDEEKSNDEIRIAQDRLWQITLENTARIRSALGVN